MAISKRPDRRNREAEIQKKQQEIDAYDEKLDSKIDIGESSEEKETLLTQTYIKKVNELQGRLNGLRKKIEVQKNLLVKRLFSLLRNMQEAYIWAPSRHPNKKRHSGAF